MSARIRSTAFSGDGKGNELFYALAGHEHVVDEEELLTVDYHNAQKRALEAKKQAELLERLSRRCVRDGLVPHPPDTSHEVQRSPDSLTVNPGQRWVEVTPLDPEDRASLLKDGMAMKQPAHKPLQTSKSAGGTPLSPDFTATLSPRALLVPIPGGSALPPVAVDTTPKPLEGLQPDAHAPQGTPKHGAEHAQHDEDGLEAFGELQQYSWLRRQCILVSTNPDFEFLVVLAIFANCVTLSLYNPLERDDEGRNSQLFWADLALNVIYSIEMILRIVALGPPWIFSYLKRPWNLFDACMVIVGYTQFIPADAGGSNTNAIRALRALRALRPLRTITRFQSLRSVVVCFMEAVPLLSAVAGVLVMFLFLYAVAAVQMFTDVYHNQCMGPDPSGSGQLVPEFELRIAAGQILDDPGMFGCTGEEDPSPSRFWQSLRQCPSNMTCETTAHSTTINTAGWDNVAVAMLTDFQCLTLTSWGYIMYRTVDGTSPFATVYFVTLIVFGSYFVVHLFLAVLKTKFAKAQTVFEIKQARTGMRKRQNTLASLFSKVKSKISSAASRQSEKGMLDSQLHSVLQSKRVLAALPPDSPLKSPARRAGTNVADGLVKKRTAVKFQSLGSTDLPLLSENEADAEGKIVQGGEANVLPRSNLRSDDERGRSASACGLGQPTADPAAEAQGGALDGNPAGDMPVVADSMAVSMLSIQEFDEIVADMPWFVRTRLKLQFRLRKVAEHPLFDNFFLVIILISTILLAMEYDGMSEKTIEILWDCNIVLTVLFTIEIAVKLWGMGFWEYFKDGFNIFDFLIVTVSWTEIILVLIVGPSALRSMRALRIMRALRVLRVLKMFKYLDGLRKIAEVLFNSFTSFFAILILLGLFWLVFTIMGLHVFGGLPLATPNQHPNFDSFLNSMLSTFNILNLENWNQQLFAVIDASNWGTVAYYVLWIVIGKYTLLSLFLAVMLEAFEAKYDPTPKGGGLGRQMSGMLSTLRSKMSSMASSIASSKAGSKASSKRSDSSSSFREPRDGMTSSRPVMAGSIRSMPFARGPASPKQANQKTAPHQALEFDSKTSPEAQDKLLIKAIRDDVDDVANANSTILAARSYTHDDSARDVWSGPVSRPGNSVKAAPQPLGEGVEQGHGSIRAQGGAYLVPVSPAPRQPGAGSTHGPQQPRAIAPFTIPDPRALPVSLEQHSTPTQSLDAMLQLLPQRAATPVMHGRRSSILVPDMRQQGMHEQQPQPPSTAPAFPTRMRQSTVASDDFPNCLNPATWPEPAPPPTGEATGRRRSIERTERPEPTQAGRPGYTTVSPDGVRSMYMMNTPEAIAASNNFLIAGDSPPNKPMNASAEIVKGSAHADRPSCGYDARPHPPTYVRDGASSHASVTSHRRRVSVDMARWLDEQPEAAPPVDGALISAAHGSGIAKQSVRSTRPSDDAKGSDACRHPASRRVSAEMSRWLEDQPSASAPADAPPAFTELGYIIARDSNDVSETAHAGVSAPPATNSHTQSVANGIRSFLGKVKVSAEPPAIEEAGVAGARLPSRPASHERQQTQTMSTDNVPLHNQSNDSNAPVASLTLGNLWQHHMRTSVEMVRVDEEGDMEKARQSKAHSTTKRRASGVFLPEVPSPLLPDSSSIISQQKRKVSITGNMPVDGVDSKPEASRGTSLNGLKSGELSRGHSEDMSLDSRLDEEGERSRGGGSRRLTAADRFRRRQRRRNGAIMIEGSGQSFWYFDEDHPVRVWIYDRVTTKWYDYIMFIIIGLNCIQMAIENPYIERGSTLDKSLVFADIAFTTIFAAEVLVKSFAFTFRLYIKEGVNQVDFLIVVVSVLVLALQAVTTSGSIATALRVLRAIKPLRMLTRSQGMRMVFKSVMLSMAAMANVSLVCIMFFLIFAILGTQLFMGLLWSCNDHSVAGVEECVGTFEIEDVHGQNMTIDREWKNAFPNFDNVGNSLLVCFITATLNGYTAIMTQAMSAPLNKGEQPQMNQNPGAFFWFVGFVFVCSFTLINLYVGVIFSQFSRIRLMSTTGSAFLTNDQQEWAELSKMVFRLKPGEKPQAPRNFLRKLAYYLTTNNAFEIFMLLVVFANTACLAAKHWDMSAAQIRNLELANYFFVAVFILEVVLKTMALGWRSYTKEAWNRFDIILVLLAILDLVVSALQANFLRALRALRVQRLVRVLRTLQLVRVAKVASNVRSLFSTLLAAMPAFGNVGSLIGLIFFMYAYVGVYIFGTLRWNVGINEHVNFRNFLSATLLLLRVATGDNWSNILTDCLPQADCDPELYNCGTYVALPYFLSFVLVVSVILLNLFTAVIVETFEKTHEQEEWKLSPHALEDFAALWSEYDDGTGTLLPRHLEELLIKLEPPLGLGSMADNKDVLRFVYDLDIPLVNGRVPFHKTIFELVKRVSQCAVPEGALKEQLDRLVDTFFKNLQNGDALNFSAAVSVGRVQRNWRARSRAAKLKRKRTWRAQRDSGPNYSTLCEEKATLVDAYQMLKEAERAVFLAGGGTGVFASRWKFNPMLLPWAEEFDRSAGAAQTLKNLVTFAWRGNKVAPVEKNVGMFAVRGGSREASQPGGSEYSGEHATNRLMSMFKGGTRPQIVEPDSPVVPVAEPRHKSFISMLTSKLTGNLSDAPSSSPDSPPMSRGASRDSDLTTRATGGRPKARSTEASRLQDS